MAAVAQNERHLEILKGTLLSLVRSLARDLSDLTLSSRLREGAAAHRHEGTTGDQDSAELSERLGGSLPRWLDAGHDLKHLRTFSASFKTSKMPKYN